MVMSDNQVKAEKSSVMSSSASAPAAAAMSTPAAADDTGMSPHRPVPCLPLWFTWP